MERGRIGLIMRGIGMATQQNQLRFDGREWSVIIIEITPPEIANLRPSQTYYSTLCRVNIEPIC